ncbi:hypothetical protein TNIN_362971 [Trichonephila inaurata madagascariensis]|uniref:Uncharacterized protein n=1 Tax=Trichonephila inaurata madagascariensis TaxID=2747483 RepID=A0A8X6M7N1_9ARAC|nr:hypothetical protein TNIN_362971 [Trichonephila inaurata madagascariensis]
MQRLPVNVQAILSASTDSLSQLAHIADKVCQITDSSQPVVYSASHSENSNTDVFSIVSSLAQKIEALTTQVIRTNREGTGKMLQIPVNARAAVPLTMTIGILPIVSITISSGRKPINVLHHVRLIQKTRICRYIKSNCWKLCSG